MESDFERYANGLDKLKKLSKSGVEYWMARDLMPLLGYSSWDKFEGVIGKATTACSASGINYANHFSQTGKMVEIGSGAYRQRSDFFLSRYGCYLVAMNAESSKPEVGFAMTYFAVQTRRQELADAQNRLELRMRIMRHNKVLAGVAKRAGVKTYAFFQDAGYKGLYGMGVSQVKSYKGVEKSEDLLDRVGRLELAANDFRITLAEHRLQKDGTAGEASACRVHELAGEHVREAIMRDHGQRPEDLPVEPSIKPLLLKHKRLSATASTDQLPPSN